MLPLSRYQNIIIYLCIKQLKNNFYVSLPGKTYSFLSEILGYSISVSLSLSFIKCLMSNLDMVHHLYMFLWRASISYIIPIKCMPGGWKIKMSFIISNALSRPQSSVYGSRSLLFSLGKRKTNIFGNINVLSLYTWNVVF